MSNIALGEQVYAGQPGETVLDTLLRENRETILLTLECKDALDYYAGQFVNLRRADGLLRSYSIGNIIYSDAFYTSTTVQQ